MKYAINSSQKTLNSLFVIIVVVVVLIVVYKVYKALQFGANVVGEGLGGVAIANSTGVPVSRQGVLKSAAADAHLAIWGEKRFGLYLSMTEDEDKFIQAVNRAATANEARLMSQFYKNISGASMLEDCNKYLSETDKKRINSVVLENLS